MQVFDFSDYCDYLAHQIQANVKTRGYKTLLAQAAGCKLSHLSQVLAQKVHLTLEQAAGMAGFWKLDRNESEYFLGLVNLGRAGTPALRSLLRQRLEALRREQSTVEGRLAPLVTQQPSEPHYYSIWYFGAITLLTGIEAYQTLEALHQRLNLPRNLIQQTLTMLASLGVVEQVGERWVLKGWMIIHSTEPQNRLAGHMTWRLKAMEYLAAEKDSDLHYTGCVTVSRADAARIKALLLSSVEQFARIAERSGDEDCVTLVLDYFSV